MNPSWVAVHPVLCASDFLCRDLREVATLREEPAENPVEVLVGPPLICSVLVGEEEPCPRQAVYAVPLDSLDVHELAALVEGQGDENPAELLASDFPLDLIKDFHHAFPLQVRHFPDNLPAAPPLRHCQQAVCRLAPSALDGVDLPMPGVRPVLSLLGASVDAMLGAFSSSVPPFAPLFPAFRTPVRQVLPFLAPSRSPSCTRSFPTPSCRLTTAPVQLLHRRIRAEPHVHDDPPQFPGQRPVAHDPRHAPPVPVPPVGNVLRTLGVVLLRRAQVAPCVLDGAANYLVVERLPVAVEYGRKPCPASDYREPSPPEKITFQQNPFAVVEAAVFFSLLLCYSVHGFLSSCFVVLS